MEKTGLKEKMPWDKKLFSPTIRTRIFVKQNEVLSQGLTTKEPSTL